MDLSYCCKANPLKIGEQNNPFRSLTTSTNTFGRSSADDETTHVSETKLSGSLQSAVPKGLKRTVASQAAPSTESISSGESGDLPSSKEVIDRDNSQCFKKPRREDPNETTYQHIPTNEMLAVEENAKRIPNHNIRIPSSEPSMPDPTAATSCTTSLNHILHRYPLELPDDSMHSSQLFPGSTYSPRKQTPTPGQGAGQRMKE